MCAINPDLARRSIKEHAAHIEANILKLVPNADGMEDQVIDAMQYALAAGGKRLRPFLVMTTSALFAVDQGYASRVAAAVECVHTYSLIHDDLPSMDDDDMRRGQPSVHKKFDEATAILAGDGLLTLAFEIMADVKTHIDPKIRCELMSSLAMAIGARGMVGGQMIDLKAEKQSLNQNEITRMQHMKTGALIVFSCEAGAILANVDGNRREALRGYAQNVGLAFQIIDDLLDVEGNSEDIGKTTGKDIEAGKATLRSLMGPKRAREYAEGLIEQAANCLQIFDKKADVLRSLAAFVLDRAH